MKPKQRSFSGFLIAIFALPVFLGLLACIPSFPVPIGDPEKSRIDPEISGLWFGLFTGDAQAVALFEPYDKRTWLLTLLVTESWGNDCEFAADDSFGDEIPVADWTYEIVHRGIVPLNPDCVKPENLMVSKAWIKKLGDERFMVWEQKGVFDEEHGFEIEEWLVWRVDLREQDLLILWDLDPDYAAFDDLPEQRAAFERAIKKNADDKELYSETPSTFFVRIPPEDSQQYINLLEDVLPPLD